MTGPPRLSPRGAARHTAALQARQVGTQSCFSWLPLSQARSQLKASGQGRFHLQTWPFLWAKSEAADLGSSA